ncbi:MAG TPA: helix-turn-helix domain-containing protein [Candidatus Lokiarchaeia archaeon]
MIKFTIEIGFDSARMNGSLNIVNKIFLCLIKFVKKIKLKELNIKIKSEIINNSSFYIMHKDINKAPLIIAKTVCSYYNTSLKLLFYTNRERELLLPRQVSQYFVRLINGDRYSHASIGLIIGGQNHATCLHSCRTIKNLRETDKNFNQTMKEIEQLLGI